MKAILKKKLDLLERQEVELWRIISRDARKNQFKALIRDAERLKEVLAQIITVEGLYIVSLNN